MTDHLTMEHKNCIERVPIFSNLSKDEMFEVAVMCSAKTYERGEMIYQAGDEGGTLYVVHTGSVKVSRISANGKEQVIRIAGPGEFMGELSLFSEKPMANYGVAAKKTTICLLRGEDLKDIMQDHPEIGFKLLNELSERLGRVETMVEAANLNTVEQRIARSLLSLADEAGADTVDLGMSKGDYASTLGMSAESLSRKLRQFQDEELIALKGQRGIILLDREGLEAIELSDE